MANPHEPICNALLVCDHAHTDPETSKLYLSGVMQRIPARGFPLNVRGIWVYCEVTECIGEIEFTLRMVDVNEEHPPLFETKVKVISQTPLASIPLCVPMPPIAIPNAGDYRIQLCHGGIVIRERRLIVVQRGVKKQPSE